jgi:2-methylcitrate dehydratase PrpD
MAPARMARETAAALYGAGSERDAARMLFDGRRVSVAGAAFAGAAQIDNLDGHDGCNPTKGHIGVAVVPALLSFGQSVGPIAAGEALEALVVGYEVGSRAGVALHAVTTDYHSSGAWNAIAVAAVGARLRRASAEQLRHALGIAEYHGPRSQMMRVIDYPTMLRDGSAWGALAGASAVFLAELGFTGAPAVTVEAAEAAPIWSTVGEHWFVQSQYIKPYPICRWAHPLVFAALQLRHRHGLSADDIVSVELATFREAARLFQGMPTSSPVAQYAISFPVAAALVQGRLGVAEIAGPVFDDPAIRRLVEATRVQHSDEHDQHFPADRRGDLTLVLRDGRRLASGPVSAPGAPDCPMRERDIFDKFNDYVVPVLGAVRTGKLKEAICRLEERGGDFASVVQLTCEAAR